MARRPSGSQRSRRQGAAQSLEPQTGYARIYAVVRRIPRGRVATYGQVAALAGLPGHARQVGYALHALPGGTDVPWHRVLNAQGGVSLRAEPGWEHIQKRLLELEGLRFDARDRVHLAGARWQPRRASRLSGSRRGRSRE